MIGLWALALAKGMNVRDMAAFVPPYPTMGEIGKRAAITYFATIGATAGAFGKLDPLPARIWAECNGQRPGERRPAKEAMNDSTPATGRSGAATRAGAPGAVPLPRGLSTKLLVLTILFVLIAEVLIFLPSVANFRLRWLEERLATAAAVSVVLVQARSGEPVAGRCRTTC